MNAKVSYGEYTPHWFADKFPLIAGKAFDEFVADIQKHGLRDPIVVRGKTLIDGRCRTQAALKAGVELRVEEFGTDDELAIINYIVSKNLQRRDLKTGQRSMLVLEAETALSKEAKQRQIAAGADGKKGGRGHKSNPSPEFRSRVSKSGKVDYQLAKMAGVAASTIHQARAVKKVDPELAAKVTAGKVTMNSAYVEVKGRAAKAPNIPARPPKLNGAQIHMQRNEGLKTQRILQREDVDPDFVGSEADFIAKYGFVWMHTAPELAAHRFSGLALGLHQAAKDVKEMVKGQRGDVEKLNKRPHAKNIERLEEAIAYLKPLLAEAELWLQAAKRLRSSDKAASPVTSRERVAG